MFSYDEWHALRNQYRTDGERHTGVDIILPAISRYIDKYKPSIPISRPTKEDMEKSFLSLQSMDWKSAIRDNIDSKTIRNKFHEQVDARYCISCGHNYNPVSNHFHCDNRYKCGHDSCESSQWAWDNPFSKRFHSMFLFMWREMKGETKDINITRYRTMFRLSGYVATQFKPNVAKTIYEKTGAKKIIDISCGWGDRLAGFYTSNSSEEFLGCDPNRETYEVYKKQCFAYEKMLETPLFPSNPSFTDHGDWFEIVGQKRVRIFNKPAEDVNWDSVCETKHDLMFTSPPYFAIERYAEGSEKEDEQSWKRYGEYDSWREGFFYPVMDAMKRNCKTVMVNIVDPVVKGKRYSIEEDIRKRYGIDYIVGMLIAKRPVGMKKNKHYKVTTDEGDKKLTFIEPVYVLGNENESQ
jgi:hypothetical protein